MLTNKQKGYFFEKQVEKFFKSKWFTILDKNFTIRGWEIDLIVEKDDIVHFVEVKGTTKNINFQDYITKSKIAALEKAAKAWINKNGVYNWYQFDLVLVSNDSIEVMENFLF